MGNEINLSGIVLAENKAAGTEKDPIISRIRPKYTDANGKIHIALIETLLSCIVNADGKRLDRIIQELQDAVGLLGGGTTVTDMLNQLIDKKVGLLELLSTTDKSTVVKAINEVNGKLSDPTNLVISTLNDYNTALEWANDNGNTMTFYTSQKSYPDLPNKFAWGHLWTVGKNIYDTGGTVFVRDNASDEIYVRGFTGSDPEADPLRWVSEWELLVTDKKLLELVLNPSIIINPDFKINQRGQTKYIGENSSKVIYTLDRWSMYNNCDVTVIENGVHVDFKNKSSSFGTYIENCKDLIGKPITVSWESSNVTNDYLACAVVAYNSSGAVIMNSWTYVDRSKLTIGSIPAGTEKLLIRFKINGGEAAAASTGSLDLKFVKAEIGNNATVFVASNLAEELLRCMRYYQNLGDIRVAFNSTNSASHTVSNAYPIIPMRVAPTFSAQEFELPYDITTSWNNATSVGVHTKKTNIDFDSPPDISGHIVVNRVMTIKDVRLDAEIY